jgi:D-alanyl-D-alanine carboxypeptidase
VVVAALAVNGCVSDSADDDSQPVSGTSEGQFPLEVRLQEAVDEFLSSRLVPGASVAVIDGGELAEVVSGMADVDGARAVTTDTQFRVASVTKMYIASLVLRLVERGELSLDETIGRQGLVLPEPLGFAGDLTLRQLLSHTSGLGQSLVRDEDRGQPLSQADLVQRMPPPVCAPSACWTYGDVNYVLAEIVLEAQTGRSLPDLLRDELVDPFDLSDTALLNAAITDTPPQYALVSDESGHPVEPRRLFEQAFPLTPTLVTSATDAATFVHALFSGDVLGPTILAEMLDTGAMRGLPCPAECPSEYGLGVFHYELAGHELVGHDGSSGTIVVHDHRRDLTVAILTNGGEQDIGAFFEAVINAVDETDG